MQGIRLWKNERNQFVVFEVHYSADIEKRTKEWKAAAAAGIPRRLWDQEYEIRWMSYEGLPVYGDFSDDHLIHVPAKAHVGLPLFIGWDFGLTPAAVIAQLQGEKLVVLREYTSINMGARRFSGLILPKIRMEFRAWSDFKRDWICMIDPAGNFRKDDDEGTCAGVLVDRGFVPRPGPVAWEARRQAVEYFLVRRNREGPCFGINAKECPTLVKGFEGGYRYPPTAAEIEKTTTSPVKDKHSHPHDALQYICAGMLGMLNTHKRQGPPRPSYGKRKP